MKRKKLIPVTIIVLAILSFGGWYFVRGDVATLHAEEASHLGKSISLATMEQMIDQPPHAGAIELQTFNSADWVADLSVLLNLHHPTAKAAQLQDRSEPIQVYFHTLRHPTKGLFMIDTGFSSQMAKAPANLGAGWVMRNAMKLDQINFHLGPADVLKSLQLPLQGVFLSHLHPDHIGGLSDIPRDTPLYVGPGGTVERHWTHFFTRPLADKLLEQRPAFQSWNFTDNANGELSVIDIFGDGLAFALYAPGHTHGNVAFLIMATSGPVLLTVDTCHTRWGWDNAVEPGSSSVDIARNRVSLLQLKALVARHPQIEVRVGHQR